MKRLLRSAVLAACISSGALIGTGACTNDLVHGFGGYTYDSTSKCLLVSGVVDVVSGPATAPCPVLRCYIAPCGAVYVTDEACDAPPDYQDDTKATSGPCVAALGIYATANHGLCAVIPDGGDDGGLGCGL